MKTSVLIVDDNAETLETVALMAKNMDFSDVHTAKDTTQALGIIGKTENIGLIICDWNMPRQSGIELLKKLRANGNLVPFIMVTARNDVDSVLEARKAGVDLYISKPFSMEEFMKKVNWVRTKGGTAAERVQFQDNS